MKPLAFALALLAAAVAMTSGQTPSLEEHVVTLLPTVAENWVAGANGQWTVQRNPADLRVSNEGANTPASDVYLYFPAETLANSATIKSVQLRLVRKGTQPNPPLLMNVAALNCDFAACAPAQARRDPDATLTSPDLRTRPAQTVDTTSAWRSTLQVRTDHDFRRYIALRLFPVDDGGVARTYVWGGDASTIPRLIVTYTIPAVTPALVRAQSDGWSFTRSQRAALPPVNIPRPPAFTMRAIGPANLARSTGVFNGLIYTVQAAGPQALQRRLEAFTPLGARVWSVTLPDDVPKGAFVVTNLYGRLAVVAPGKVLLTQLRSNAAEAPLPPSSQQPGAASVLRSPSAVTMGPEGTLYIADETGLYAFAPDLRLLWTIPIGASDKARLTLSPDSRVLYAAAISNGRAALMAINAPTGRTSEIAFPSTTTTFHEPVVVKHPGGADYVFVAANSGTTGVLRCIKSSPQAASADNTGEPGMRLEPCGDTWKDIAGPVGQPMLDATLPAAPDLSKKRLYAVAGNKLLKINAQSGATETTWDVAGLPSSMLRLWSTGSPLMDASGNLLFWENGAQSGALYGLSTPGDASSTAFSMAIATLPLDTNWSFGSDGVLYAMSAADYALRAVIPRYDLPVAGITELPSPTHVEIGGVAGDQKTWIIRAPSVSFAPGFRVAAGATLTVTSRTQQTTSVDERQLAGARGGSIGAAHIPQ